MKELDQPTAEFIRLLNSNQPRIAKKFPRRIRIIVIWLDGDKQLFTKWATENKIENVELGVVAQNDANLVKWKVKPDCPQTAVLLNKKVTLASYADPDTPSLTRLEANMDRHFAP